MLTRVAMPAPAPVLCTLCLGTITAGATAVHTSSGGPVGAGVFAHRECQAAVETGTATGLSPAAMLASLRNEPRGLVVDPANDSVIVAPRSHGARARAPYTFRVHGPQAVPAALWLADHFETHPRIPDDKVQDWIIAPLMRQSFGAIVYVGDPDKLPNGQRIVYVTTRPAVANFSEPWDPTSAASAATVAGPPLSYVPLASQGRQYNALPPLRPTASGRGPDTLDPLAPAMLPEPYQVRLPDGWGAELGAKLGLGATIKATIDALGHIQVDVRALTARDPLGTVGAHLKAIIADAIWGGASQPLSLSGVPIGGRSTGINKFVRAQIEAKLWVTRVAPTADGAPVVAITDASGMEHGRATLHAVDALSTEPQTGGLVVELRGLPRDGGGLKRLPPRGLGARVAFVAPMWRAVAKPMGFGPTYEDVRTEAMRGARAAFDLPLEGDNARWEALRTAGVLVGLDTATGHAVVLVQSAKPWANVYIHASVDWLMHWNGPPPRGA